ncbi:MAG: hypothetical protein ABFS34_11625 [Gemmatimonadota bacterium]
MSGGTPLAVSDALRLLRAEGVPARGASLAGADGEVLAIAADAGELAAIGALAHRLRALGFRYVALDLDGDTESSDRDVTTSSRTT